MIKYKNYPPMVDKLKEANAELAELTRQRDAAVKALEDALPYMKISRDFTESEEKKAIWTRLIDNAEAARGGK